MMENSILNIAQLVGIISNTLKKLKNEIKSKIIGAKKIISH